MAAVVTAAAAADAATSRRSSASRRARDAGGGVPRLRATTKCRLFPKGEPALFLRHRARFFCARALAQFSPATAGSLKRRSGAKSSGVFVLPTSRISPHIVNPKVPPNKVAVEKSSCVGVRTTGSQRKGWTTRAHGFHPVRLFAQHRRVTTRPPTHRVSPTP